MAVTSTAHLAHVGPVLSLPLPISPEGNATDKGGLFHSLYESLSATPNDADTEAPNQKQTGKGAASAKLMKDGAGADAAAVTSLTTVDQGLVKTAVSIALPSSQGPAQSASYAPTDSGASASQRLALFEGESDLIPASSPKASTSTQNSFVTVGQLPSTVRANQLSFGVVTGTHATATFAPLSSQAESSASVPALQHQTQKRSNEGPPPSRNQGQSVSSIQTSTSLDAVLTNSQVMSQVVPPNQNDSASPARSRHSADAPSAAPIPPLNAIEAPSVPASASTGQPSGPSKRENSDARSAHDSPATPVMSVSADITSKTDTGSEPEVIRAVRAYRTSHEQQPALPTSGVDVFTPPPALPLTAPAEFVVGASSDSPNTEKSRSSGTPADKPQRGGVADTLAAQSLSKVPFAARGDNFAFALRLQDSKPQPARSTAPTEPQPSSRNQAEDSPKSEIRPTTSGAATASDKEAQTTPSIDLSSKNLTPPARLPLNDSSAPVILSADLRPTANPPQTGETAQPNSPIAPHELPPTMPEAPKPAESTQIQLHLTGNDQSSASIRVTDRGGTVNVSVHASDPQLRNSLKSNLSDLSGQLSEQGWKTEVKGMAATSHSQNGQDSNPGRQSFSNSQRQSSQDRQQNQRDPRPNQGHWQEELEQQISGNEATSGGKD